MKKEIMLLFIIIQFSCKIESTIDKEKPYREISYPVIAHSHNDYEQKTPIYTALKNGFTSLEVDIIYDGTAIKVSHDEKDLEEKPEFEASYLIPLIKALDRVEGDILLLVDIKKYDEELLRKLNAILEKYGHLLKSRDEEAKVKKRISVLLSGEIPRNKILTDKVNKYLFVDGRVTDLEKNFASNLMPLISMDFTSLTKWDGLSKPNQKIIEEIKTTIQLVHDQGKLIRFWKTKDNELVWLTLIGLEVDIIGVDEIDNFYEVMKKNNLLK